MNYKFIGKWLSDRSIITEQSFVEALRDYSKEYKKNRNKIK